MPKIIIYNRDKVFMTSKRCSFGRTPNINVNQLKKTMQMVSNGVESHLLLSRAQLSHNFKCQIDAPFKISLVQFNASNTPHLHKP